MIRYHHLLVLLFCIMPAGSMAATFTANITADLVDVNPGDGVCAANPAGDCTLRAAIMEANALGGEDTIELLLGTYTLTLDGNDDTALQGDLDILDDLIIEGVGRDATVIDGNHIDRIFQTHGASVIITDLTIRNGLVDATTFQGGGILVDASTTCTLERVRLADNTAEAGGAIRAFNNSLVTIRDSLITGNALITLGQTNTDGTAFFCKDCDLVMEGTTVTGNLGGDWAITVHDGSLTMQNNTVSGNAEGGVRLQNADALITFSTLTDNGPGVNVSYFSFDGLNLVGISASILQNATANNCAGDLPTSAGYNVLDDASCAFTATGDLQNASAELGPLQDNGGPTPTHLPAESSPAIDAVPLADCNGNQGLPLNVDQRGAGRPVGAACDSGAVEVVNDHLFSDGFEGT